MAHLKTTAPRRPQRRPPTAPRMAESTDPGRRPPPPLAEGWGPSSGAVVQRPESAGPSSAILPGLDTPELQPPEDPNLSAGQRLTLRRAILVAAGIHPLRRGPLHPQASQDAAATDPRGLPYTCGSCVHRNPHWYPKCTADKQFQTSGEGTDCRAWWPACTIYQAKE